MPQSGLMDQALRFMREHFKVTEKRADFIFEDISRGSTPASGYYALIAAASLIAGLGLVANSAAVVIGAMLVSPLMTPIFGMALGMIRGNPHLLGRSVRAEVTGVALAIAFGAVLGILPIMTEVTPEMLARTQPTLLDLLVAVFAGLAGTLAVIDERISPALPGVAISTAIVPPLSTCGLCLAVGAWTGAYGAFLLFFANFLAILLVASLAFLLSGMGLKNKGHMQQLRRRLVFAAVGFLLVSAYLTHALLLMVRDRQETKEITSVFSELLKTDPNSSLVSLQHKDFGDEVSVLATLRATKAYTPKLVKDIQDKIETTLEHKIRLVVRCVLSKDISPTGSTSVVISPTLDGQFISDDAPPNAKRLQLAEQTLRELFAVRPQLLLLDVDLVHILGDPVILASIQSSRALIPYEVNQLQEAIQKRLGDPAIRLLARCQVAVDVAASGRIMFGSAHFGPQPQGVAELVERATKAVQKSGELFVTAMDAVKDNDGWRIRTEITGTRVISTKEVKEIETQLSKWKGEPVRLMAWSGVKLVVMGAKHMPAEAYTRQRLMKADAKREARLKTDAKTAEKPKDKQEQTKDEGVALESAE